MHEVLVNRLGGLSLPRKSVVRLTDRPDMTLDVYRGRKTTMQQQQSIQIYLTLLHSDRPKLDGVLAVLNDIGLNNLTVKQLHLVMGRTIIDGNQTCGLICLHSLRRKYVQTRYV